MSMVAYNADKDSLLYNCRDRHQDSKTTSMVIIYEGKLVLQQYLDKNVEIAIDYIDRGCILNAHNFLASRPTGMTVKCLTAVTYYYLPYDTLLTLSTLYPDLRAQLNEA